jgi:hypothetical protein
MPRTSKKYVQHQSLLSNWRPPSSRTTGKSQGVNHNWWYLGGGGSMKMWQLVGQGVEVAVNMQGGALDLQKHHVYTKGWGYNAKESHISQG